MGVNLTEAPKVVATAVTKPWMIGVQFTPKGELLEGVLGWDCVFMAWTTSFKPEDIVELRVENL